MCCVCCVCVLNLAWQAATSWLIENTQKSHECSTAQSWCHHYCKMIRSSGVRLVAPENWVKGWLCGGKNLQTKSRHDLVRQNIDFASVAICVFSAHQSFSAVLGCISEGRFRCSVQWRACSLVEAIVGIRKTWLVQICFLGSAFLLRATCHVGVTCKCFCRYVALSLCRWPTQSLREFPYITNHTFSFLSLRNRGKMSGQTHLNNLATAGY